MAAERRRRCEYCAVLFRADPRVGKRQRACSKIDCQEARRAESRRPWLERNEGYFRGRAVKYRADVAMGVKQRQDVAAVLPVLREQDEMPPQVQLLLGVVRALDELRACRSSRPSSSPSRARR